jgi:hypothetical protein
MKPPKCPYCGGPLTIALPLPMSARKRRIYDALVGAGPLGVRTHELIVHMHGPDENLSPSAYGQLRREVCEINKKLREYGTGQINGRERGRYRLLPMGT